MKRRATGLAALIALTAIPSTALTTSPAAALSPLSLDSISQRVVVADGSESVEVRGSGFGPGTTVLLGTERLTPTEMTPTRLSFTVPRLPRGAFPLAVEREGQRSENGRSAVLVLRSPSAVQSASAVPPAPSRRRVSGAATATSITDPNLAACVAESLGLPEGSAPSPAQVASLTSLACQDQQIQSLAGLQEATQLSSLDISRNSLTSLEALRRLPQLRELWASENLITDLSPLADKTGLSLLDVSANRVSSLSPLSKDQALVELIVDDNAIADLSPLTGLTRLRILAATFNQIGDLQPLSGVPLTELQLWGNKVTSLAPIASCTGLTHLDVSYNNLASLAPVAGLTAMTRLNVEGNRITDLGPLRAMSSLTEVNANANLVRNVAPLAGLTKLYWVFLRNNSLHDLSALRSLTRPTIEAQGQLVTLPVTAQLTTTTRVLDRHGAVPSISGARQGTTGLVWPEVGSRSADFATQDLTFTGTVKQVVRASERFGDASDDGRADLFTISGTTMTYWQGAGSALAPGRPMAGNWGTTTMLAPMHDNTGDRLSDLMSRDDQGSLWMHPVLGPASLGTRKSIGRNWNGMGIIAPAGRLDGTAAQFVVARRSDGGLFRYMVTPNGLTGIKQIGWRWNAMRQVLGVGDWTGDGREDVLGLRLDGTLWLYESTATGTLRPGREVGHGWQGFRLAAVPGDLGQDGRADLVGLRDDGTLFGYQNRGGSWGEATVLTTSWGAVRLLA